MSASLNDAFSRGVLGSRELLVVVVTAGIGAPLLVWLTSRPRPAA
ncbi:MAG: hypothetical protein AAGE01_03765 [Pseudomonadota bacterium]